MTPRARGLRGTLLAGLVLLLAAGTAPLRAEDPDPYAYDDYAREHLDNPQIVSNALNVWLNAAGAALGREDWRSAFDMAGHAFSLYQTLETEAPGAAESFARQAGLARMAQAKATAEQQDHQTAADLYRQSAAVHPDARAWISAGQLAGRSEDWHQARRDFEEALEFEDVPPVVYLRLAEVLYHLGYTDQAIETIEEGVEKGADRKQAEAYLERFRREAGVEEGYSRGGTSHFRILFEDVSEQDEFRRRVESSLERVYERVCRFLGTYPRNRVPVVIYPSPDEYRAASEAPTWSAAVYNGKIRVPTGDLSRAEDDRLDRILAHEFAHYLIERLAGRGAPAWLQEGLAQHVEGDGEAPAWLPKVARKLLRRYQDKPFPLKVSQIEGSFHGATGDGARAAYVVSYYVIASLIRDPGRYRVDNLMGALKQGLSPEEALEQECFMDYEELEEHWQAHARSQLF